MRRMKMMTETMMMMMKMRRGIQTTNLLLMAVNPRSANSSKTSRNSS
jgi:hypothetical protein